MRAITLLSGGLDSSVALYWACRQGWEVHSLEFEYHERPERERRACAELCARAGVARRIVTQIPFVREVSDLQESQVLNAFLTHAPQGYIPLRNLIFYSLAGYHAEIIGARYIVGGHNRTDGESFPDAGRGFWEQLNRIFETAIWSHRDIRTEVVHPLLSLGKVDVVRLGMELGVPFDLTWSCYHSREKPCGRCESCLERAEAFAEAGLTEP